MWNVRLYAAPDNKSPVSAINDWLRLSKNLFGSVSEKYLPLIA
jgi:hypothetical protein